MATNPLQPQANRKDYPAVNLIRKDPGLAAVVSKLTTSRVGNQQRDDEGNRKTVMLNSSAFKSSLQRRAKRNADSTSIMRLLPDIELSAQILVSSILSPKDMTTMELLYLGPKNLFSPELSASLLNRVKEHFEESYKIKALLPEMLRDALFEKGSYPVAVIPENAIDDFINGNRRVSVEALRPLVQDNGMVRNIGILGNYVTQASERARRGVTMEGFHRNPDTKEIASIDARVHYQHDGIAAYNTHVAEEYLLVTDNPTTLKIPRLNAKTKAQAIKRQFASSGLVIAAEAHTKEMSDQQFERLIYRNREQKNEPVASIRGSEQLKRRSIGNPLIMKLPSESVIPVHVPGNVKQHIGYFVLLDEEGNPLDIPDGDQYYNGLSSNLNAGGGSLASNLIRKVETNIGGTGHFNGNNHEHLNFAAQVYADMVERNLISRVKNGTYASGASLAKNEDVYRIMLARVLAKKYTQLLYIPLEFVTYIAFKYGDDGIGRSLMDDTSMINTMRTILLFNDVLSSVKNSIGRTKVSVTLPEHDPNPMKTLELMQDEVVRSRMLSLPLGVSNPADITEFIQRAGYEWEFNGNKGMPDLKFDFQEKQTSYAKSDTDLQDLLRKSSIMAFGLSPETVENGFNAEFATTATYNNILLGKRVMMHQEIFTPQVSDHMRKVVSNTEGLVLDLKAILSANPEGIRLELEDSGQTFTEEIKTKLLVSKALQEFLNTFYVELPKPTSVTLENQLSDLKTYSDALDAVLDAYIADSFFTTNTAGEIANDAGVIREMIKAYYMRKFITDKGIMPELSELTAVGDDGQPQLDFMKNATDHVQALVRSGITALATLQPIIQAGNKDLAAMGAEPGEGDSAGSEDSGGGTDEFEGDNFGGGADDFGGEADELTEDEEPVADGAADEPEPNEDDQAKDKAAEEEQKKKDDEVKAKETDTE
jgi:hypothetical protein